MSSKVEEIQKKIDDLKARLPRHSVRPSMIIELEDLEEELEKAKGEETDAGKGMQ